MNAPDPAVRRAVVLLLALMCAVCADGAVRVDGAGDEDHMARARAALDEGRAGDAWWHVRKAVRSAPDDAQAVELFTAFWRDFDRRGFLNAGRSVDEVVESLGTPDGRGGADGIVRLVYGYIAIEFRGPSLHSTIDLRGLRSEAIRPREQIELRHDGRGWTVGSRHISRSQDNTEYVLPGQAVQDWTEMLSVQRIVGVVDRGVELRPFADGVHAAFREHAPEGTWRILSEDEQEIVYEFVVPEGSRQPAQHEVARLIRGRHDIHRVAYVRKGAAMREIDRRTWVRVLERSRLRAVRRPGGPAPAELRGR